MYRLVLSGGHDGSAPNQFDDPTDGFYAPHETRVMRLSAGAAGGRDGPLLRFGACTAGLPPSAPAEEEQAAWAELALRHRGRAGGSRDVLVHGLQRRADLNGRLGELSSRQAGADGRYAVNLEAADGGEPSEVLVKPANLRPAVAMAAASFIWCDEQRVGVSLSIDEAGLPLEGSSAANKVALAVAGLRLF